MRNSQRVKFPNQAGQQLAGILELPVEGEPRGFAVFSHCFTCTKDLKAIVRISRRLAELGLGVLRYDFTGLGDSQGDFSATTFRDNVADVTAAAEFLQAQYAAPAILIGHSLGGAASIVAARALPSVKCLVNIASPAHTLHLANHLVKMNPEIASQGSGEVVIGGQRHLIRMPMIEVLRAHDHPQELRELKLPLLVMFSPQDETLPYEHGLEKFRQAGGPTSFINLEGTDHLLVNDPTAPGYVADLINAWAARYV
ncbi:MAG: alpha/beta hydrolase [Pirellulaceae bacterium]|nr:alpha/beta hydrolase [Pirellulaceae bacterium]